MAGRFSHAPRPNRPYASAFCHTGNSTDQARRAPSRRSSSERSTTLLLSAIARL